MSLLVKYKISSHSDNLSDYFDQCYVCRVTISTSKSHCHANQLARAQWVALAPLIYTC